MSLADLQTVATLWSGESWWIRRTLSAAVIGAGLGVVGSALQRYLNNDLADPYLLGVSSASLLGAVLAGVFFLPILPLQLSSGLLSDEFAFWVDGLRLVGALSAAASVLLFLLWSQERFYRTSGEMVLLGIVVNAFCGALIMLLMSLDHPLYPRVDVGLLVGRIEAPGLEWLAVQIFVVSLSVSAIWSMRKGIAAAAYGFHVERLHSADPRRLQRALLVWVCLISATASAFAGSIAFVGLIVPHLARLAPPFRSFGHQLMGSAVLGAFVLCGSDFIAQRVIYPRVLPVGVVTSFMGSIALGWVLFARVRRGTPHA